MRLRKYSNLVAELEKLRERLKAEGISYYMATFDEVEEWSGTPLPPSAYEHRAWWSNNDHNYNNSPKAWDLAQLDTADVDMRARTVSFRLNAVDAEHARKNAHSTPSVMERLRAAQRSREHSPAAPTHMSDVARPYVAQKGTGHHPLRGALKGTLRIVAGTDLTKPADPDWADRP